MEFIMKNIRTIDEINLSVDKLVLVAGTNLQGKTTAAQLIAQAMTGKTLPFGILKKNIAQDLISAGSKKGFVSVTGPNGAATIKYPGAEYSSTGDAPLSSPYAVGLESPVSLNSKKLAAFLSEQCKMDATKEDFIKAAEEADLDAKKVTALWGMITKQGWDSAHKTSADAVTSLKGEWKAKTGGETWGVVKGEEWVPEGMKPEEEDITDTKKLVAKSQKLEDERIKATGQTAIDENKMAELKAKADKIKELQLDVTNKQKIGHDLTIAVNKLRDEPVPKPTLIVDNTKECPHCKKLILVTDGILSIPPEAKKVPLKEKKAAANKHITYEKALKEADATRKTAWDECDEAEKLLKVAEDAKLEYDKLSTQETDASLRSPEVIGEEIKAVDALTEMVETRVAAAAIHERIKKGIIITAAMADDGARKEALLRGLQTINVDLKQISDNAGWSQVWIDEDLQIMYGEDLYEHCSIRLSESSQIGSNHYRVKVVFQIYMALKTNSELLIFDSADILDAEGRMELVMLLDKYYIPAVVFMTLLKLESVPDLSVFDGGASYWIDDGALTLIEAEKDE